MGTKGFFIAGLCAAAVLAAFSPGQPCCAERPTVVRQYKTYTFPNETVAQFYYFEYPGGRTVSQRALARGKIKLPTEVLLLVTVLPGGLEHIDTLNQLPVGQFSQLDAAGLEFEDSHMEKLRRFTSIWRINLDDTTVTDKSVEILSTFKLLQDVRLSKVGITGANFEKLNGLPLRIINFNGSSLKEGNLARIKTLPEKITNINLSRTDIGPADIAFIGTCRKLTSLNIGGAKKINDACMRDLAGLTELETLFLDDTAVTEKSLPLLARLPKLRKITVRDKTFWAHGPRKSPRANLIIEDTAAQSRTPLDVFEPLH